MLKVTKSIETIQPHKLIVGQFFIHPVSQEPCKVVDFPYSGTLTTFINLTNHECGVFTSKRSHRFRPELDIYTGEMARVQLCVVSERDELVELKGKLSSLDSTNDRLRAKNIQLVDELTEAKMYASQIKDLAASIRGDL